MKLLAKTRDREANRERHGKHSVETIQLKGITELQVHLYSVTLEGVYTLKTRYSGYWITNEDLFHGKIISSALSIP